MVWHFLASVAKFHVTQPAKVEARCCECLGLAKPVQAWLQVQLFHLSRANGSLDLLVMKAILARSEPSSVWYVAGLH